jgi:GMP synthase-like glutamine amidotransferase
VTATPILILQHVQGDPPGLLATLLQEHHLAYQVVQIGEEPLPDLLPAALIVLGGPQTAYDESLLPEKALIRRVLEHNLPCLGICLGGQVLAEVCGAHVHVGTATEIGFYELPLTDEALRDELFEGFSGNIHQVFNWHNDTFDLPPGAVLLETGVTAYHQAFRYGQRAYGLQYHPELTQELFHQWIQSHPARDKAIAFMGQERYQQLEEVEGPRRYPIYHKHSVLLFTNFLHIAGLL